MFYHFEEDVFSSDFCDNLLKISKKMEIKNETFKKSILNISGKEDVKNKGILKTYISNKKIAKEMEICLLNKLKESFPLQYREQKYKKISGSMCIYKYESGQQSKHRRDAYKVVFNETSLLTLLVYLNDEENETILMPNGYGKKDTWVKFKPKKGSALIFDQNLWYQELPTITNEKNILKTDLYFN